MRFKVSVTSWSLIKCIVINGEKRVAQNLWGFLSDCLDSHNSSCCSQLFGALAADLPKKIAMHLWNGIANKISISIVANINQLAN